MPEIRLTLSAPRWMRGRSLPTGAGIAAGFVALNLSLFVPLYLLIANEPLAKIGNRPGFLCRKPQARDGQWAGRSVCRMAVAVTAADEPETRGFMGPPGRL